MQAVSIATPPFLHRKMVEDAIKAGKHVLCEKSLATNVEDARDMLTLAEESGLVHMTDFEFRYIPAWAFFKELFQAGKIGDLLTVDIKVFRDISRGRPWTWRHKAGLGGGSMIGDGIHFLDALRYWFGEVTRVAGTSRTYNKQATDKSTGELRSVETDDTFATILQFSTGAVGVMHYTSMALGGSGAHIEAAGSEGALAITPEGQVYFGSAESPRVPGGWLGFEEKKPTFTRLDIPQRLKEDHGLEYDPQNPLLLPFARVADQFIDGLDKGRPISSSFRDGYIAQLMMDAITRAYETGRWIDINP